MTVIDQGTAEPKTLPRLKQRYRADHLLCAPARVKRKDGRVDELGLVAVLSGDNLLADYEKRVDKMARRTGGGQVLVPERSAVGV